MRRFCPLAVAALLSLPPFALAQAPTTTGSTFRITPQHSVAELEKQALASRPPKEQGEFRKPDLVELVRLDPRIKLDIRYATTNNFLSTPMYSQARAFLQRPAAEALVRVEHAVEKRGYGLLVHDAYRPWYVTKMFWDATPDDKKIFVADPKEGSKHNRGCAVDLTPTPIIRAGRPSSGSVASSCVQPWSTRASPSTHKSGGTSTTKTGSSIPS